jgi:glycosyltransferase involved in cell wall biosynthesis
VGYDTPLISVVMITYNHEKYIAESIESVLKQTFEDFEFIIVNDGSNDGTDEVIRSFQDPRITYIYQENQGPSAATNNGILVSRGKYIALMSGDDACYPQRLEIQYQYLNSSGKKIVFSWVDFVDDDSQPFTGEHFAQNYFNHPNRTRAEILNWFFMEGNYLCAVTALIEKDILLECGLFNLASIQLQDFDMWIKIVKKYDLTVIEEKLVKYRIRANFNNLSDPANLSRMTFERCQIYRNILNNVSIELFKSSFSNQIKRPEFQEGYEYELEKAFLYLGHISTLLQSIGVEKLFDLLQNEGILFIAKSKYSFSLPELYKLTKDTDITNSKKQRGLECQLQQTQIELEQTKSQLQQTQIELGQSQSQLQQTQIELGQSQSQLQQTQIELGQSQSQLQQTQTELEQTQFQLHQTQAALEYSNTTIAAMYTSKFWKLRQIWFRFKHLIGLVRNNEINV